jgi:hypothetical protein
MVDGARDLVGRQHRAARGAKLFDAALGGEVRARLSTGRFEAAKAPMSDLSGQCLNRDTFGTPFRALMSIQLM